MTCKKILLLWIEEALRRAQAKGSDLQFKSHHIEEYARSWGKKEFGEIYSGSTYMRRFREIREEMPWPEHNIHTINEINSSESRESSWHVIPERKMTPAHE